MTERHIDRSMEQGEPVPAEDVDQTAADNTHYLPHAQAARQAALNAADAKHVGPKNRTEQHFRGEPLEVGQVLEVSLVDPSVDLENFAEGMARMHALKWRIRDGVILFTITPKTDILGFWHHLRDLENDQSKIHTDIVSRDLGENAA